MSNDFEEAVAQERAAKARRDAALAAAFGGDPAPAREPLLDAGGEPVTILGAPVYAAPVPGGDLYCGEACPFPDEVILAPAPLPFPAGGVEEVLGRAVAGAVGAGGRPGLHMEVEVTCTLDETRGTLEVVSALPKAAAAGAGSTGGEAVELSRQVYATKDFVVANDPAGAAGSWSVLVGGVTPNQVRADHGLPPLERGAPPVPGSVEAGRDGPLGVFDTPAAAAGRVRVPTVDEVAALKGRGREMDFLPRGPGRDFAGYAAAVRAGLTPPGPVPDRVYPVAADWDGVAEPLGVECVCGHQENRTFPAPAALVAFDCPRCRRRYRLAYLAGPQCRVVQGQVAHAPKPLREVGGGEFVAAYPTFPPANPPEVEADVARELAAKFEALCVEKEALVMAGDFEAAAKKREEGEALRLAFSKLPPAARFGPAHPAAAVYADLARDLWEHVRPLVAGVAARAQLAAALPPADRAAAAALVRMAAHPGDREAVLNWFRKRFLRAVCDLGLLALRDGLDL